MVEEERLQYCAFKCNPDERVVFDLLQVWFVVLIRTHLKTLKDEEDVLADEDDKEAELGAYCLSNSLLILSSDVEDDNQSIVLQ